MNPSRVQSHIATYKTFGAAGSEEMEEELNAGRMRESAGFSLCIAKISQGLRKFRNYSENFAIPAKFLYAQFIVMIA